MREKIEKIETDKNVLEIQESKLKKEVEVLKQANKVEAARIRKDHERQLEDEHEKNSRRVEALERRISEIEEELETAKLERDKLEKQN